MSFALGGDFKAPNECANIEDVRHAIDQIDRHLIDVLSRRFLYVKTITRFKETEEDVRAPERFQAVLASRRQWAESRGLDPEMIETLYRHLIDHFIAIELKELNGDQPDRPR